MGLARGGPSEGQRGLWSARGAQTRRAGGASGVVDEPDGA